MTRKRAQLLALSFSDMFWNQSLMFCKALTFFSCIKTKVFWSAVITNINIHACLNKYVFFFNFAHSAYYDVGMKILWNSWCRLINFTITLAVCSLQWLHDLQTTLGWRNKINIKQQFNTIIWKKLAKLCLHYMHQMKNCVYRIVNPFWLWDSRGMN